jgi:hypothetical protein
METIGSKSAIQRGDRKSIASAPVTSFTEHKAPASSIHRSFIVHSSCLRRLCIVYTPSTHHLLIHRLHTPRLLIVLTHRLIIVYSVIVYSSSIHRPFIVYPHLFVNSSSIHFVFLCVV